MSIQIKDKGLLVITSNLLDGRNDIRDIRLSLRELDPAALRPYLADAAKMVMDELTTIGAFILHQRDKQFASDQAQADAIAKAKADATDARKAAWSRLWPITGRGAFDVFAKGVGLGEVCAFSVNAVGACTQWSTNAEWRDASKRNGMQAGLSVSAGVVVVSVPVASAETFVKRFTVPAKCFCWDAQGLRSFAMAIPAGLTIACATGFKSRITTGEPSARCSFAPLEGFKIVTAPGKVALDEQGQMPECPPSLLATLNAAAGADPHALDAVLTS